MTARCDMGPRFLRLVLLPLPSLSCGDRLELFFLPLSSDALELPPCLG